MKITHVKSGHGHYKIFVGQGLLEKTGGILRSLNFQGKVLIVTQPSVARFHLKPVLKSIQKKGMTCHVHEISEGESGKSADELFRLFDVLIKRDFERRDMMVALGGGVVGDVTGFAAASYLRGVPYINIGTTLLAQVDSSIGGKTGINLKEGKNLVGAFNPPRAVISDIKVLATLPTRDFHASLGEVVKYGMIRDVRLFQILEREAKRIFRREPQVLEAMVTASSRIKADVVTRDEYETKGERMILNFGHTFGHAFEQALDYRKLVHGEAVAIGMVAAASTAVALDIFPVSQKERLVHLLEAFRLPTSLGGLNIEEDRILSAMYRDKKKKAGKLRFVLPSRIGKVVIRDDVPLRIIQRVISSAMQDWSGPK